MSRVTEEGEENKKERLTTMARWPQGTTQARRPCPICGGEVLCLPDCDWLVRYYASMTRAARAVAKAAGSSGFVGYCHHCGHSGGEVKTTRRAAMRSWFAAAIRYLEEADGATYHRMTAPGKFVEVRHRLTAAQAAAIKAHHGRRKTNA